MRKKKIPSRQSSKYDTMSSGSQTQRVRRKEWASIAGVAARVPLALLSGLLGCGLAPAALADTVYTISYGGTGYMDLQTVMSGVTGDTTFLISKTDGSTTRTGGTGQRVSSNDARLLVQVNCDHGTQTKKQDCPSGTLNMEFGIFSTVTGRARMLTAPTIQSGTATVSSLSGAGPYTFTMTAPTAGQTLNFYLAGTFAVGGDNSGKSSGDGYNSLYVKETGTGASTLGKTHVLALHNMSIAATKNMLFGTITKPPPGVTGGKITVSNTGARTAVNGAAILPGGTGSQAQFTITGEAGQAVTVTVPASFPLTSGSNSLTVNTTNDLGLNPTIGGTANSNSTNTLVVNVGGSIDLDNSVPTGTYTGSFTITAVYN